MMDLRVLMLIGGLSAPLSGAEGSGRASAEWVAASAACKPASTLQTAIRLTVDPGWHSYWLNPGASGMPLRVEWELPAGWTASDLAHPVPERFDTGGLAGFGYEGTVWFPVTVTAPANFTERASLKARLSWLTCNETSCLPGNAELTLEIDAGPAAPTAHADALRAALLKLPRSANDLVKLRVTEKQDSLLLTIEAHASHPLDLTHREVFPATPEIIDSAAVIRFVKQGAAWTAEVPKSEYAPTPVPRLTLVIAGDAKAGPIELTWTAD